jgi:flavin reductase (DIM6/NTAB) family NADH-FMN oxidoreductase RutF
LAAKLIGGYAGARAADQPREVGVRIGVLLNTRGLTELVMLQAGLTLGILSPPLFAAFVVMSLLATAMTGPAYALMDWYTARRATGDAPEAEFRALMSGFPSGVAIVTTEAGDGTPRGMTCSSVCNVSVAPPTLLVCLRQGSPTLEALLGHGAFSVNLLHDQAQSVAELFSSGLPDRFDQLTWRRDDESSGAHLIEHAHTIADCDVTMTVPVGDHVVVFGRVARILRKTKEPPSPLMYGMRRYSTFSTCAMPDSVVPRPATSPAAEPLPALAALPKEYAL